VLPCSRAAGTLALNLAGAFALGYVVGRRSVTSMSATAFSFVAIGLLGSFTTFSAFAFEVCDLLADARSGLAMGYAVASVVVGLVVAGGGILLGERR
jgi:CrcB protein